MQIFEGISSIKSVAAKAIADIKAAAQSATTEVKSYAAGTTPPTRKRIAWAAGAAVVAVGAAWFFTRDKPNNEVKESQ